MKSFFFLIGVFTLKPVNDALEVDFKLLIIFKSILTFP